MKPSPFLFALLLSSAANAQWTPTVQTINLPKPPAQPKSPAPVAVSMPKPPAPPVVVAGTK